MSDEVLRIQRMVAEGKVTSEEGAQLMASVGKTPPPLATPVPVTAPEMRAWWFLWPLVSHAMIGTVVAYILLFVVPKFKEIFKSFEMALPAITVLVLRVSTLAQWYFFFLAPACVVLLAADVAIYVLLRRYTRRVFAELWWWAVTLALIGAVILIVLAVFLPHIQLMSEMGRQAGGG